MQMLADTLIGLGAPGKGAPASLRWLSDWLPDADLRVLSADDLRRIDNYRGGPAELHELLAAALPTLRRPRWYEATVTAAGGTEMILGYGGVPMGEGIDIGFACFAPAAQQIIGPLGPARVTTAGIARPDGISDMAWHELRAAAGIVLRGILLSL